MIFTWIQRNSLKKTKKSGQPHLKKLTDDYQRCTVSTTLTANRDLKDVPLKTQGKTLWVCVIHPQFEALGEYILKLPKRCFFLFCPQSNDEGVRRLSQKKTPPTLKAPPHPYSSARRIFPHQSSRRVKNWADRQFPRYLVNFVALSRSGQITFIVITL